MRDPVRSYRESAVRGASPLGLIVILYDEIVRSLRKASRALELGDVEGRSRALNHVAEVIGYLQSILDFEKGGDVARNLSNFYNLMRGQILQIQAAPTPEGLEMLAREFAKVGAAWQQAERSLTPSSADEQKSQPQMQLLNSPSAAANALADSLVAMER
jgi:flagellar secretion chaperone FliS